jgi:hypothetical protein
VCWKTKKAGVVIHEKIKCKFTIRRTTMFFQSELIRQNVEQKKICEEMSGFSFSLIYFPLWIGVEKFYSRDFSSQKWNILFCFWKINNPFLGHRILFHNDVFFAVVWVFVLFFFHLFLLLFHSFSYCVCSFLFSCVICSYMNIMRKDVSE